MECGLLGLRGLRARTLGQPDPGVLRWLAGGDDDGVGRRVVPPREVDDVLTRQRPVRRALAPEHAGSAGAEAGAGRPGDSRMHGIAVLGVEDLGFDGDPVEGQVVDGVADPGQPCGHVVAVPGCVEHGEDVVDPGIDVESRAGLPRHHEVLDEVADAGGAERLVLGTCTHHEGGGVRRGTVGPQRRDAVDGGRVQHESTVGASGRPGVQVGAEGRGQEVDLGAGERRSADRLAPWLTSTSWCSVLVLVATSRRSARRSWGRRSRSSRRSTGAASASTSGASRARP